MGKKIRVMVADDNAAVLLAVCDVIEDSGEVDIACTAPNVEEAVRLAALHQPDIAFIDAWLKGGGAELATRRITAVSPATVVVALASVKELELVLALRAAGAAACYEKEQLSSVLPAILAGVSLP
jgi:DNA-binding NarL/FixJ family response regulator